MTTSKSHYSEPIDGPEIHGITAEEIHTLGKQSAEAKTKAYCPSLSHPLLPTQRGPPTNLSHRRSVPPTGPYSNFRVGSALLLRRPLFHPCIQGANVENASYPVGTCAERVAVGTAVAGGARAGDFRALAVATDLEEPCSPCGMCRQFLREFCDERLPVFMFGAKGDFVVRTLGEVSGFL
jgi:cytidine deaminase